MKKLLSIFLALILSFACFSAMLGVSAELEEGAPFTAYDGKYALKIEKYTDDIKKTALPKVNISSLSNTDFPSGQVLFDVSVTYRLDGTSETDSGIRPVLRLYYNTSYWYYDVPVCEKGSSPATSSGEWTTVSATGLDATDFKWQHEYDKIDDGDNEGKIIGAAILLHTQGERELQSDVYVDSVSVKMNGTSVINESFEDGHTGSTDWESSAKGQMSVVLLGEKEAEKPADFSAYKGEFALKIGKYTDEQNTKNTVKLNLSDLSNVKYPDGSYKFFISVTYRLGGENLSDNGIKPILRLFYNDKYFSKDYTLSETATVTSDKWTTVSGVVDASEIKSLDDDNSLYAAALLFHGVGSREVLSDLYIDEVKVEQVSEDGTHNAIISEGFEGLYDSSVTFVKNKIEGDNGFKAAIDFVRLGEATENISAVAADVQTVYEGSRALRIYRYNRFWDTNLCFDFWDGKIHQQELDSIDFTVSAAYYNYGDKPMKLNAWLYYCYNDESFKDPVPFEGEVTGLKGDWVEYTGTVKVDLDSSKKLAITRIILGEDMKKSDATTAYDYAIDNLVVKSSRTGDADLCKGNGGFEDDSLLTDSKGIYIDQYANKSKKDDSGNVIRMETVTGPCYTEAYTPILSEKTIDADGQLKVEALVPQTRTRYEMKEYGVLFHRAALLGENELKTATEGVKKAYYSVNNGDTLPEKYTAVLTDPNATENGCSKGYKNTEYAARPYVVYFDNIKNEDVTYYGEQVTSRSADCKTMPLGDFVNKAPTKLELTEDNSYVLTTESLVQLPVENTVFDIELNSDYRVGFIAGPGSTLNSDDGVNITKGIVKWFKNGDKYRLHYLYLYVRVFVTHKDNIDSAGNIIGTKKVTDINKTGLKLRYISSANIEADNLAKMGKIAVERGNYAVITHGSDIHGDIVRLHNMMNFSEAIHADFAAVTGDITAYADRTGFSAFVNAMLGRKTNVIATAGNHDIGFMPVGADSDVKKFNQLFSKLYNEYGYQNSENKGYYYKDDTAHKLRMITLDQYEREGGSTAEFWEMHMNQSQVDFLINTLNSTPEGYSVVLAYHSPENARSTRKVVDDTFYQKLETSGDGVPAVIADIIDAFIGRTSIDKTYDENSTYARDIHAKADFSNAKATFVAHMTGHQHIDGVAYLPTTHTQLMLNVSCMTASKGVLNGNALAESVDLIRSRDGYTEDCFNTYIIDTDKKEVKIIRIGADTLIAGGERKYMTASYAD